MLIFTKIIQGNSSPLGEGSLLALNKNVYTNSYKLPPHLRQHKLRFHRPNNKNATSIRGRKLNM